MKRLVLVVSAVLSSAVLGAQAEVPKHPKFGFPVYTNAPSGRQLTGQHKPADNPALSPADAQKAFVLPPGFEVRLFASEPEVVNPVAMTWDERGRLWVLELYEYPLGTKPGEKGRDRIKILEDTDNDGQADTVKVFADGMTLATGLLVGNGGVYVGEAPHLWFLRDTNGDDMADERTEVLTGFGLEDRHELLNGFAWGPDGQLYLTHGVFTRTQARDPKNPHAEPVALTAGVARLNPKTGRFEVFAEGTSNPWGVDFDRYGNAFVSACVIDHLFHLAPGGIYQRQAGQPPHPYAYELLPSIVDHKHHMAAYAGINIYQGDQWPKEWQGAALHGNIHQNAINIDRLTPQGSSFLAGKWNDSGDFLTTKDGWFMPVSTQTGPDGAAWIMDWYDRYPCYQNANADPAGVDRERGRIWRVVWTGGDPNKVVPSRPARMNLATLPSSELVNLLAHSNVWQRRMAQRILNGRGDVAGQKTALTQRFRSGATLEARLAGLWTLHSTGQINDELLDEAARDKDPAIRAWAARLTGERRDGATLRLDLLAADSSPVVRSAVATAMRQHVSGSLTVNTPPPDAVRDANLTDTFRAIVHASRADDDRTTSFLVWTAMEPMVVRYPERTLGWLASEAKDDMPLTGKLAYRIMRRFCDTRDERFYNMIVDHLGNVPDTMGPTEAAYWVATFEGLLEGQRGKAIAPTRPTADLLKKLLANTNKDVAVRAQQLGVLWGDVAAVKASLARINDASASEADRIAALRTARKLKTDDTRAAMTAVLHSATSDVLKVEAVRGLSEVGVDDTARQLLEKWDSYPPSVRAAVAELVTTRGNWKWPFYSAVERGEVKRGDIPPTVIRALATSRNENERNKAVQIFGRVQATSEEKLRLIAAKRKIVVDGPVDLAAGREVAKKTCFVCHKLHGEGADIGPDLTGVGRSSLDALLHNVIHPNEIIGAGYEQVEVENKDDQTLSGRMVENTATRVKLVMAGPTEAVLDKSNVKAIRVTENSAMPEGLENMPDADFRNLIWFILVPPEDGKPLTPQRRKELSGESSGSAALRGRGGSRDAAGTIARDGESIALWNPEWQVDCLDFEGAPAKLPEFAGRRNVLMTHPSDAQTPAALVRPFVVPATGRTRLTFAVAAHEHGDWELRVLVDGEKLHQQLITHDGERWNQVAVDLTRFAGSRLVLRLENRATDWAWEFGYWSDVEIRHDELATTRP